MGVAASTAAAPFLADSVAAATTRHGISFDRVLDAVEDLGMDPNGNEPIDDAFASAYDEGTLIEFPPGEYLVTETHRNREGFDRFGIRGLGDGPRDVQFVPRSGDCRLFIEARFVADYLIENVSFQERDDESSGMHHIISSTGGTVVRDVEWLGRTPKEPTHRGEMLVLDATTRDGVCLLENVAIGVDAPAVPATYPDGVQGVRCSTQHKGELIVRNPTIRDRSSTALRCTVCDGVVTLEGGEFVNNLNSSIRFGAGKHPSKKSSATGSYVRLDDGIAQTDDKIDAVRVNSSGLDNTADVGATFRDITIESALPEEIPGRAVIGIPPFADHGRAEFYDCEVRNDGPAEIPTVWAADTTASDDAVRFENCDFSGSGGGFLIENRPDSVIRDSCVDLPNGELDGIVAENLLGCDGSDDPSGSNPDDSDGDNSDGDNSDGDNSDGDNSDGDNSDGDESEPGLPNTLAVRGTGTPTRYAIEVSGEIRGVDDTMEHHDDVGESAVEAWVTFEQHVDEFTFTGEITSFEYLQGGPVDVSVNGWTVDDDDLVGRPESRHSVALRGRGRATNYAITVSGDCRENGDSLEARDQISESTLEGWVTSEEHVDEFAYTGEITDLEYLQGGPVDLVVDDESVDPNQFVSEPVHALAVRGTGTATRFSLGVSGEIDSLGDTAEAHDDVGESAVEAWVTSEEHVDEFAYTGEITSFEYVKGGPVDLTLDGESVDPDQFASEPVRTLEVRGAGTPTRYAVDVSGEIHGVDDTMEHHDDVGESAVEAWVTFEQHVDEFTFTGEITSFEYVEGGPVDLAIDGESVDVGSLPTQ